MRVRIYVPCLGPGELVTATDEPAVEPEQHEVVWYESEIDMLLNMLDKHEPNYRETYRVMWIRFIDAAKRIYPRLRVNSFEPELRTTPQLSEAFTRAWVDLPRR